MLVSNSRRVRAALLATVAAGALGASAFPASAQTASNIEAARVLLRFSQLNSTPEGRAFMAANLQTVIAVNRNSTAAQRAQAIADNPRMDGGVEFAAGLGSKLGAALIAGVGTTGSPLSLTGAAYLGRNAFSSVAASDANVAKSFFGNGTTNGTTPFVGLSLPAGGVFDLYDVAYGITPLSLNPFGNPRPYQVARAQIDQFAPTIQGGSNDTSSAFPSGAATNGAATGLTFAMMVPERYQELLTRGAELGYGRLVLGVHYPTDVIGGRILGIQTIARELNNDPAYITAALPNPAAQFATAMVDVRAALEAGCGASIAVCAATSAPDRFSDYQKNRADYLYTLTYGLPPTGPTNLAPVVPVGAEVLLSTRLPYLTAAQRRDVLASTEIASGAALDDGSGWARLNLFDAASGYGYLTGEVRVSMNAASGGFNAFDTWRNDIGGTGSLVKEGTGTLALAGNNSFTGPITILGGTLAVTGSGSLPAAATVNNSAMLSLLDTVPTGRVTVRNYTGGTGSTLALDVRLGAGAAEADRLIVTGTAAGSTTIVLNDLAPTQAGQALAAPVTLVSTSNAAAFTLQGGAYSKGLYAYRLSASADQVRLVSGPSADATRLATIPTAMQEIWSASADVWRDRRAAERDGAAAGSSSWVAGFGRWSDQDRVASSAYDLRAAGVLGGVDTSIGGGGKLGVLIGYVEGRQAFDNTNSRFDYEGMVIGATGSFVSPSGLFADLAVKADLLKLRVQTPGMAAIGASALRTNIHAYGASATVGYHLPMGTGAFVEPLVGLSHVVGSDSFDFAGAAVAFESGSGTRGRLGVRAGSNLSEGDGMLRVTGEASLWTILSDGAVTSLDSRNGAAPTLFSDDLAKTFGEVRGGLQYQVGAWSAALHGGYRFGSDYHAKEVSLAVRYAF